jgi:hypothetical protein
VTSGLSLTPRDHSHEAEAYDENMRRLLLAALLVALAPGAASAASIPFRTTLTAPTHTPKANARWYYIVRLTDLRGAALRGTVTVQIKDPLGALHYATYDGTKRNIANFLFTGRFRDYAQFPPESRGFTLTVRVTVKARGAERVLTWWIRAR